MSSPSKTYASAVVANNSAATGHCLPRQGSVRVTAQTGVRPTPVYTNSPASSRSVSVVPRGRGRPPASGTMSVVVDPMSMSSPAACPQ